MVSPAPDARGGGGEGGNSTPGRSSQSGHLRPRRRAGRGCREERPRNQVFLLSSQEEGFKIAPSSPGERPRAAVHDKSSAERKVRSKASRPRAGRKGAPAAGIGRPVRLQLPSAARGLTGSRGKRSVRGQASGAGGPAGSECCSQSPTCWLVAACSKIVIAAVSKTSVGSPCQPVTQPNATRQHADGFRQDGSAFHVYSGLSFESLKSYTVINKHFCHSALSKDINIGSRHIFVQEQDFVSYNGNQPVK